MAPLTFSRAPGPGGCTACLRLVRGPAGLVDPGRLDQLSERRGPHQSGGLETQWLLADAAEAAAASPPAGPGHRGSAPDGPPGGDAGIRDVAASQAPPLA